MKNALVSIDFTIDVPEEKVAEIIAAAGIEETDSDHGYETACRAVEEWAKDNWLTKGVEWMTDPEPEFEVTA